MSDTVLVVGGGLTGLRAAADIAAAGSRAIVLEQQPMLGGKRAAVLLGPDSPDPRLAGIIDNPSVACHTLARLVSLDGEAGQFTATVTTQPRYVTADCTRCNHCVPVCPQVVPNEFDAGLTYRKAIFSPLPETVPDIFSIDIDSCLNSPPNYLPCQRCVEVCDDHAIHFDMAVPGAAEHEVAAVIIASGFAGSSEEERAVFAEFGYGTHPNIVSAAELQRLLEDPGPSGGFAVKPSDEDYPESVLLVLTAVSGDATWVMENHLRRLAGQDVEKLGVLLLCAADEETQLAGLLAAAVECGADYHFGSWIDVQPTDGGALEVDFTVLPRGAKVSLAADLVALYSEARPDPATAELAGLLSLERDERGYLAPTRAGVYVAGGATGTMGIEAGALQAEAAAQAALEYVTADDGATPQAEAPDTPLTGLRREDIVNLLYALQRLGAGDSR
jgi:heterodisulfide reductase subunit A